MHYKNGREAKNGDKVVLIPSWTDSDGKKHFGEPIIGILFGAKPGVKACNGYLAPVAVAAAANLDECLHLDDVLKALPAEVPDTSKKEG